MPKLDPHDAQEIRDAKNFLRDLRTFQDWMATLSEPDKNNFTYLVNLPNARELLAKCPSEEMREMGWFALHVLSLQRQGKVSAEVAANTSKAEKVSWVKSQGQSRKHHCHWPGCDRQIPPALWGCKEHWNMLPKYLRDEIWEAYAPGQEVKGTPSKEYIKVARKVQQWIKEKYNVESE